jgi:low affinity Fe/Cu permease
MNSFATDYFSGPDRADKPFVSRPISRHLEALSTKATKYAGSSAAFAVAGGIIVLWAAVGPLFGFSDTWQLVINTGTTIVTFLMVFLIQRSQNKETAALQLKLNELVAAVQGASNRLIDLEDWSEEELQELHEHYRRLAFLARKDNDTHRSLSVDSADQRHRSKEAGIKSKPAGNKRRA